MKNKPVKDYIITSHALFEMKRRGLSEDTLDAILSEPGQRLPVRKGRVVLQSLLSMDKPSRTCLVRVFVDVDRHPAEVVTAYRTSKISKYWSEDHESEL
ncbi:MAG: DUF4258 domain-containing protein [Gemmatimonadota bacterium]|nr:DUF4258 domain-containing protein [Gemmatimonadota bacterium]